MTSQTREAVSLDVGRENTVFVKFLFSSQSFAPLVFLFHHCPSVVFGSEQGAGRDDDGVGGGVRSQGKLAVTQFFVHLPPEPGHVLLAEAERLP